MCWYYAIARYTGTTQSVLECMLQSEKKKSEDKGVSQYGVVVAAMCKCLLFGAEEIVYQYDLEDPVAPDNFFINAKRLKLKQITDQACSDVFNSDGRTCHVTIDRSTVGEILERLNIPIRVGGGNEKRLDPKNTGFLENFLIAVRQYAPEFEGMFSLITPDSFRCAFTKSETSEKVMMKSYHDGYCKGAI
ncbi:MAG: hypothetical protein MRZ15_06785 [Candidatus Methanomethylophilus alvus]|nr:hypothetical protein [Methanomethylophilus alvi]MDY7060487.1 hypothetical protein [Methanomethylophilus alvi]